MPKKYSIAFLAAFAVACGGPIVPGPDAPLREKQDACARISADGELGCGACAGLSYCAWTQTNSPAEGTCAYVEPPAASPAVSDPQDCPKPSLD